MGVKRRAETRELELDHNYPFDGSKQLNETSVNQDPVQMSLRTQNDFTQLIEESRVASKSGYEKYKRTDYNNTKGLFANDPQRTKVVKHPGDMQVQNYKDLLSVNPQIKNHLEKQMALEDKKLQNVKQGRIILDRELNKAKNKIEKNFLHQSKKEVMGQWQKEPRLIKQFEEQH